jgi:hypothetical protein
MANHNRRAIVYVAQGERHILEAITSAKPASIVGVARLLTTNAESRSFLEPASPFERVIEHTFSLPGLLPKMELFDVLPPEYDSFLFRDTDTHVLLDIGPAFEKADTRGIAVAPAATYNLEHF